MRWKGRRQSDNVEDRRAKGPARKAAGIGGLALILVIASMFIKGDFGKLLGDIGRAQMEKPAASGPAEPFNPTQEEQELAAFIKTVLAYTEDVWNAEFRKLGKKYQEPTLVLFRGSVQSACGVAGAQVGPFYCPADNQVYIDLSFYKTLREQLGAGGDFAQAYVVAHEVGHHVQNLLGASDRLHRARGKVSQVEYNRLSVRLELQADFYAGLWAHHAQKRDNILERGDIEEAMNAAKKIGDDALQRRSGGAVRPDSFTHGTSEQRRTWFELGLRTGDIRQGDTFDEAHFRRVNGG
ncbi:MAG: zinc metallopeptidase [Planctomycetota bacterium]|nr:zinc metallopeptidase [Planctomycetota bacterium]